MLEVKYEGVSGNITMDENGDPIKAAAITAVTGGKTEFVKFVAAVSTSDYDEWAA